MAKTLFTQEIMKERITSALRDFGEYAYYDKGAQDVMDIHPFQLEIERATVDDCTRIGTELAELSEWEHGSRFITSVLVASDGIADEQWEALTKDERVARLY